VIATSLGAEIVALGTENGDINLWNRHTVSFILSFTDAHISRVTHLSFTNDR
jgi:hypothetical protein